MYVYLSLCDYAYLYIYIYISIYICVCVCMYLCVCSSQIQLWQAHLCLYACCCMVHLVGLILLNSCWNLTHQKNKKPSQDVSAEYNHSQIWETAPLCPHYCSSMMCQTWYPETPVRTWSTLRLSHGPCSVDRCSPECKCLLHPYVMAQLLQFPFTFMICVAIHWDVWPRLEDHRSARASPLLGSPRPHVEDWSEALGWRPANRKSQRDFSSRNHTMVHYGVSDLVHISATLMQHHTT